MKTMKVLAALTALSAAFPVLAQSDRSGPTVSLTLGKGTGSSLGDFGVDSSKGNIFGVSLGYDARRGPWVIGGIVDLSVAGIAGEKTTSEVYGSGGYTQNYTQNNKAKMGPLVAIRARAGHAFGERRNTLVYGTVGLAGTRMAMESSTVAVYCDPQSGCNTYHYSGKGVQSLVGTVAGLGVEHSFSRDWSLQVQALRYQFGNISGGSEVTRLKAYTASLTRRF